MLTKLIFKCYSSGSSLLFEFKSLVAMFSSSIQAQPMDYYFTNLCSTKKKK